MANEYVKKAVLGYSYTENIYEDFSYNDQSFTGHGRAYVDCTELLENFLSEQITQNKKVRITPYQQGFGLLPLLSKPLEQLNVKLRGWLATIRDEKTREETEKNCYLKLYIEFVSTEEENYSFVRNYWYVKIKNNQIVDLVNSQQQDDENPFLIPPEDQASFESKIKNAIRDPQAAASKSGGMVGLAADLIGGLAVRLGANQQDVQSAIKLVKENPTVATTVVSVVVPRLWNLATGKEVDLSIGGIAMDGARSLIIGHIINYVTRGKLGGAEASGTGGLFDFGGGSSSGGGNEGGALGRLRTALVGSQDDLIVYDRGASKDPETAELQRCLIRFGGGNLEAERKYLPSAYYELNKNARGYVEFTNAIAKTGPIVGTKGGTPEKPVYYADDGRFGDKTLVAVKALYQKINAFNKSSGSSVEIKDPQKIPTKILQSPACIDQSSPTVQPGETAYVQKQLEKMKGAPAGVKKIEESKVYTEFSFLSTKNSKLHSVLMEQLKKDLKRG